MLIGVLALQGDFREHRRALERLGVDSRAVKLAEELEGLDGLILPGGESTTMGKLMADYQMIGPLREFGKTHAIWGTCAGAILLSQDAGHEQPLLKLMSVDIARNAFGRQLDSFEINLKVPFLTPSVPDYHLTFIRGPVFTRVYGQTEVLLNLPDGRIIAVKDRHFLGTSFHPELTDDLRFHRYFMEMVIRTQKS